MAGEDKLWYQIMLNVKRSGLTIILIITLAFIFTTEQNLKGAAHAKIYEASITDSNPIKPPSSILLSHRALTIS